MEMQVIPQYTSTSTTMTKVLSQNAETQFNAEEEKFEDEQLDTIETDDDWNIFQKIVTNDLPEGATVR